MKSQLPLILWASLIMALPSKVGADAVDKIVRAEMQQQGIPGISIAVVRDGRVIKAAGYGFANLEHRVRATADTIYQTGSVGKQFTAALVMLLVEDGKLALDGLVSQYLPESPNAWSKITIRHLLTHTSGLGDPYDKLDLRKDYTDAELLRLEGEIPLLFQPGEKWSYSNMGYHVLGWVCTRVGGKFYADQLRERIFSPLGMETAQIIDEAKIIPHRAAGYIKVKDEIRNQSWVAPNLNTTGDGSLYVTVRDMAKWDVGLYTEVPLNKTLREQIWTPVRLNDGKTHPYGFGWQVDDVNGHRRMHHGGAWQGFTTYITRYAEDHLTVIVLVNLAGAHPGQIAKKIAETYIEALRPPVPPS